MYTSSGTVYPTKRIVYLSATCVHVALTDKLDKKNVKNIKFIS